MNKLKGNGYIKFFKIALIMSFFSLPSLGSADDASSIQLLEEIVGNVDKIVNDGAYKSPKVSQKSRQDLEVLLNTSWEMSYSLGGTARVSKMELSDNIEPNDNDGEVPGVFFRDVNGESGDGVICLFVGDEPDLAILSIDFLCPVRGAPFLLFGFKISDNNITKGIFASGNTAMEVSTNLVLNSAPMTGCRIDGTAAGCKTPPPPASEASYNDRTNELIIPVVNYNGAKYRVILQDNGNLAFTLKDAVPVN